MRQIKKELSGDLMKWLKVLGIVLALFIALLLSAALLGPKLVPIKSILIDHIEARLNRPVSIGEASFSLLGGFSISVSDLVVQDLPEFGDRPFIKASSFRAGLSLMPLLASTLVVDEIEVDGVDLSIVKSPVGLFNVRALRSLSRGDNTNYSEVRENLEANDPPSFWSNPKAKLVLRNASLKNVICHIENQKTGLTSELSLEQLRISGDARRSRVEVSCTATMPGFSLEAKGSADDPFRAVTLQDVIIAFRLDAAQVGQKFSPIIEGLETKGIIEFNASAAGPPNALRTDAALRIENGSLDTKSFGGRPISMDDLLCRFGATADVVSSTAKVHRFHVFSRSAGVDASFNGEMQWPARLDSIAFEASSTIQLDKLRSAMGPLIPGPTTIAGTLVGKASLGPAPVGGVAASGSVRIRELEISRPDSTEPYNDPNVNLDFEALIDPQEDKIEVSAIEISSLPLRLNARGYLSRNDASLGINAKTSFDYVDRILEGVGAISKSVQLSGVGVLTGRIEGTVHSPRIDAKIALADSGILVGRKIRKPRGVPAEIRLVGRKNDEVLQLDNLELLLGPVHLSAEGKIEPPSGNVDFLAELAPLDLAGLAEFSPELAERAPHGKVRFKLSAKGNLNEGQLQEPPRLPEISGEINFQKVSMTPRPETPQVRPVLTGSIIADPEQIRLEGMSLEINRDTINLEGEMKAYRDWPVSNARLLVDAELLDLNMLLSLLPSRDPQPKEKDSGRGEAEAPTSPEEPDSSDRAERGDVWRSLQAKLDVRSERFIYKTFDVEDFLLNAFLKDSRLQIENLSFNPVGGSFSAQGELDMTDPELDFHLTAAGRRIKVTPADFLWLKDEAPIFALPLTGLGGTLDLDSDLTSRGPDFQSIQKNLNGSAKLEARDGVEVNFGFIQDLFLYGDILKRLPLKKVTVFRFSKMDGTYRIENGTINYDMSFSTNEKSPAARLVGFTILADQTVEARLRLDERVLGRDLGLLLGKDGTLSIKITGKIGSLTPVIQFGSESAGNTPPGQKP